MLYPAYVHIGDNQRAHGVTIPDFSGCFSAADEWENLPHMIQEAAEVYFEDLACLETLFRCDDVGGQPGLLPLPYDLIVHSIYSTFIVILAACLQCAYDRVLPLRGSTP
jgi:predicted RNase H-like HicB family nuclease